MYPNRYSAQAKTRQPIKYLTPARPVVQCINGHAHIAYHHTQWRIAVPIQTARAEGTYANGAQDKITPLIEKVPSLQRTQIMPKCNALGVFAFYKLDHLRALFTLIDIVKKYK